MFRNRFKELHGQTDKFKAKKGIELEEGIFHNKELIVYLVADLLKIPVKKLEGNSSVSEFADKIGKTRQIVSRQLHNKYLVTYLSGGTYDRFELFKYLMNNFRNFK